jgi:hypothetical protein
VWKKFLKENIAGVLIGVIGLVAALVTILIGTDLAAININVRWFIVFLIILLTIIIIMFQIIIKYNDYIKNWKKTYEEFSIKSYSSVHKLFIVITTLDVPINTIMTVFYEDDGFEVPVGLCKFVNSINQGYVLSIEYHQNFIKNYNQVIEDIENGNRNKISKLKIKNFIIFE